MKRRSLQIRYLIIKPQTDLVNFWILNVHKVVYMDIYNLNGIQTFVILDHDGDDSIFAMQKFGISVDFCK